MRNINRKTVSIFETVMRVHIYFNNEKNIFALVQINIVPESIPYPHEKAEDKINSKPPKITSAIAIK